MKTRKQREGVKKSEHLRTSLKASLGCCGVESGRERWDREREGRGICTSRVEWEGWDGKKLNFQLTVVFNLALSSAFADVAASLYNRFYVFESVLPVFQWLGGILYMTSIILVDFYAPSSLCSAVKG